MPSGMYCWPILLRWPLRFIKDVFTSDPSLSTQANQLRTIWNKGAKWLA